MTISQRTGDPEQELPDPIQSGLRNRYGPVPGISPETDRVILADARRQLSARIQPVRRHRRWSTWHWTALASSIAAASVMMLVWQPEQPERSVEESIAAKSSASTTGTDDRDVDQSGRVDILDAFAIARLIRQGDTRAPDVNRDGQFDQLDVDLVAREAVML